MTVLKLGTIVLIYGALAGCASDRFLTKEEDEGFRAWCPEKDCVVIQAPVWQKIEQMLRRGI